MPLLEPGEDPRRVEEDLPVRLDHGDEVLAGDGAHGRAVGRIDVDPLDGDALVPGRERDALDVGGERDAVDADQIDAVHSISMSSPSTASPVTPTIVCAGWPAPPVTSSTARVIVSYSVGCSV